MLVPSTAPLTSLLAVLLLAAAAGPAAAAPATPAAASPVPPDAPGTAAAPTLRRSRERLRGDPDVDRLHAWHRRWRREAAELRLAFAELGRTLALDWPPDPYAPSRRDAACRRLAGALGGFDERRVFPSPSYALDRALAGAVGHLRRASALCHDRRPVGTHLEVRRASRDFAVAARLLAPYGLSP